MRRAMLVLGVTLVATPAGAQTLASRVAGAPDGVVRMEFPSRPGVCGDGRDVIGYRNALFARNFRAVGSRWSEDRCVPGPLRVSLEKDGGQVTAMHPQVGGSWPATSARVTDLGVVDSREASAFVFSLVPRLESVPGRDRDRALIPAVLAEDVPVTESLLALARSQERTKSTRREALLWLGLVGEASGRTALRGIIEDARQEREMRKQAIFSLAHGEPPQEEFTWLRGLYSRVSETELKEAILHGMGQEPGPRNTWLLDRATDADEEFQLRKTALFWAGQREETPTAELVRVYRDIRESALREHAIFVLSQRRDDEATDALMRIAQADADRQMRGKALFWLGQRDDPRVRKFIADIILK